VRRAPSDARVRSLALAAALATAGLAGIVRPEATPGPPLRDFESSYAAGATWRYHGDAYGRDVWRVERKIPGVVATRDELLPFVGPPFGLPLWDALARFPWNVASLIWGVAIALSCATIVFGSLRLAGGRFDATGALAATVLAGAYGPLTSGAALGQTALVSCAAIVAVPFLLGRGRTFAVAGAALVAALQPNLGIVLVTLAGVRRARIGFALAALIVIAGSFLALASTTGIGHYAEVLREHAGAERFIAIQTTPAAVTRAFGLAPGLAGAFALAVGVAVIVGVGVQTASGRYSPLERLALACAALPLALPFAHEHDFTIAFLPALLAVRRARGTAWVLAAIATLAVSVDWLGLAQRPSGIAQAVILAIAGACALAVLARERLRVRHAIPLGMAAAVALAGALAARHPLPTWPSALPAGFHVPPTLPAPVVWHAEQVLSGVAGLDPVWGALRLASLLGCALLWAVASVVFAGTSAGVAMSSEPAEALRSG
jgi:hypothetical protein